MSCVMDGLVVYLSFCLSYFVGSAPPRVSPSYGRISLGFSEPFPFGGFAKCMFLRADLARLAVTDVHG